MSELLQFFKDMRDNGYGLAEIAAQLGTSAIAEPVAGFAAMYDPVHGADAIREGMTYQPRSEAAKMYQQGAAKTLGAIAKPAMPVIDAWQRGVDIAGRYSPMAGAALQTVPTALGVALGAKPALEQGRQLSNSLGSMQARMVANANAPRTLNTGFRGQRGAVGLTNDFDNSDEIKIIADYLGQSPESMLVNRDLYTQKQGAINSLVSRYEQMDDFSGAYYPTSYGYISISPSAKSNGQWQLTSFDHKMNPLSDQGEMPKNKALTEFFKTIKPNKYGNSTPKKPLTEFEQAHATAQRNAALPVEKGGLGLPADNTAMDRARAMGFDVDNPVYHGTDKAFDEFKNTPNFFSENKNIAEQFGKSKEYLLKKGDNQFLINQGNLTREQRDYFNNLEGRLFDEDDLDSFSSDYEGLSDSMEWGNTYKDAGKSAQYAVINAIKKDKYTHLVMPDFHNDGGDMVSVSFDPKNIRSRFAAFDPMKRDSANLLAQYGAIAPTTALGAYMYNEKRKKSQGNQ